MTSLTAYRESQLPAKKVPARAKDLRRSIAALRLARCLAKTPDPLLVRRDVRARNLDWERRAAGEEAAAKSAREIRLTLLGAARQARALGFRVTASKDRDGRISSYYIATPAGPVRISDHALPQTAQRDCMARAHGREFFDGYHGPEIIIDRPLGSQYLRDLILTAGAGRF